MKNMALKESTIKKEKKERWTGWHRWAVKCETGVVYIQHEKKKYNNHDFIIITLYTSR